MHPFMSYWEVMDANRSMGLVLPGDPSYDALMAQSQPPVKVEPKPRYRRAMTDTRPLKSLKEFRYGSDHLVVGTKDLTKTQLAVLEHLCETARRQKAQARYSRTSFRGGWTHVRTTQQVKLATVVRLLDLGLATACCHGHYGTDTVRITRAGIELLERVRGEEIFA